MGQAAVSWHLVYRTIDSFSVGAVSQVFSCCKFSHFFFPLRPFVPPFLCHFPPFLRPHSSAVYLLTDRNFWTRESSGGALMVVSNGKKRVCSDE